MSGRPPIIPAHVQKLLPPLEKTAARELATITAGSKQNTWPVKIKIRDGEYFEVTGRGTMMELYLTKTSAGYLVAVPNYFKRCGYVPAGCDAHDIMDYVGIDNFVDATTLAAAIRYLISAGLACSPPAISMLPEKAGEK